MARKLRLEFPGAIYHVMNRGDRPETTSRDDGNLCRRTGRKTWAEKCRGKKIKENIIFCQVLYPHIFANHISAGIIVRMLLPEDRKENMGRKMRGQKNEEKRTQHPLKSKRVGDTDWQ